MKVKKLKEKEAKDKVEKEDMEREQKIQAEIEKEKRINVLKKDESEKGLVAGAKV